MISRSLRKNIRDSLGKIAYKKVILFGSRARGDYSNQSDFDLLVILSKTVAMPRKIHLSTVLRKRFASRMIDADVLVKDSKDIEYLKDKPGSIVRNALKEGISL
ncbi:MAG: nucleotidyltransferase domain-containing protein [Candidatus Omnitrophica bacterium]|nr:nucleotidyltransferase domain-containing protein [Candidatus Omnitrophota bacterium]